MIGGDPYGAVGEEVREEDPNLPATYLSSTLILNDYVMGEEDARIQFPDARKLKLKVNADDLHPRFLKGVKR